MFLALLQLALSVNILHLSLEETLDYVNQDKWTFIMASPSADYEFPTITRSFIRSAHLSTIDANFIVLDTTTYSVNPEVLNVSLFPVLIYAKNGRVQRVQYRGFDDEFFQAFFVTNAIKSVPVINTKNDLDSFYSTNSVALIIAIEGANEEKYPILTSFYKNHFHEITIAFANPKLFPRAGNYIYKFLDSSITPIEGDISVKTEQEIALLINENCFPEFFKLNGYIGNMYEDSKQEFVILMLVMEDFYLTSEQLELARYIKEQTGLNVTYADVENSQILSYRYGLPDSLDSTMAVIDHRNPRVMKYMLSDQLTKENAVKLIKNIDSGKASPFWKSEVDATGLVNGLTVINANSLLALKQSKKSFSLVQYYSRQQDFDAYINATKILSKAHKDFIFGRFSLSLNDWPDVEVNQTQIPYLLVYKNGQITYQSALKETTEEITLQLSDAIEGKNQEL